MNIKVDSKSQQPLRIMNQENKIHMVDIVEKSTFKDE
jgi:hypothetical protein